VPLPLKPPLKPQLARSATDLPAGDDWRYEPKWDGFRTIVFRDGDDVHLQSRNGKPMNRYFPEVVPDLLTLPGERLVLDGELIVVVDGIQEFDLLGQRIHPAESRVRMLAEMTPAAFVAFDLLAEGDESLVELPYEERRARLEGAIGGDAVQLTPMTPDGEAARTWLTGRSEGVVANTVGSLILGLYNDDGDLQVVGHTSGFTARQKRELVDLLEPYRTHERGTGEPSRWKSDEELVWEGLRPELVCEVAFDHITGHRIRHGAKFKRWREDKDPQECRIDQLRA
jgi:ATP-dependent DNA ligase